ncbi:ECF transporter S component [Kroppenstedtia eburnea]|uniref:Riboflavin transporter n=1 Tax=Kroppenstedtia eburnea TaxID=714067 RepID=A0A1N7KNG1_9BACL|nr:ECF transporter S component [Kroppenstedtia eburnea]QKI82892.1 ECF transporter S component [Kroppenstedtia eburnea]SIS63026.1 Riboflavin transporter FmnP [Kroppenstedtia eburnea]
MAGKLSTRKLTMISLLSGFAFLIQYLNFPVPPFPAFLKVDFSELPALVAGLMFGPLAGVTVEFVKNLLHFAFTGSESGVPIGQMANFLAGSVFVLITVWTARKIPGTKGLIAGLGVATLVTAILMSIVNYWVILPAYAFLINWTVEGPEKTALVLYGIGPFNLLKGLIVALVFVPLYRRLKPRLKGRMLAG